jgi:hypothetical protein
MIPRLEEIDPISGDAIYQAVLARNSPAPATGVFMTQRLGLANSLEWVCENRCHQVENPQRDFAICLNPAPQILAKVR